MKICFISIFAYPLFNEKCPSPFGGAEAQMSLLAKELSKDNDFEINFIVGDFGQKKIEDCDGVRVFKSYKVNKAITNYLQAPIKINNLLKQINPDIVICRAHGPETYLAAKYCQKYNKKFIYSIAHENDLTGRHFKGMFGLLFKKALKHVDYFIAQNQAQLDLLKKPNASIIKTGYKIEETNEQKEFVLWVARAEKWKRPEIYLDLVKRFPAQKFVMIMPLANDINYWQIISQEAKKLNNLKFIEKVPFEKIDQYFKKAKIFVNTSEFEGFPNTFIQAAKNKTPVLSLKVNPDNLGIDCQDDAELLEKNLGRLLTDQALYQRLSQNAFQYAEENHDIKKIGLQYKVLIKKLFT